MDYIVTKREDEFNFHKNFLSEEEAISLLSEEEYLGLDLETSGLSFMDSVIRAVIISTPNHVLIFDIDGGIDIKILKPILEEKSLTIQRAVFDLTFLYANGIIPNTKKIYDTYLGEYAFSLGIDTVDRSYKGLVNAYFGIELEKESQKEFTTVQTIADPKLVEYMFNDGRYLLPIRNRQIPLARKIDVVQTALLDSRFSAVLSYIEYCGIYFDQEAWMKVCRRIEYEEYGAWLELNEWIRNNTERDPDEINWNSPAQIKELFTELGIDLFDKKLKKETTDAKFLIKIDHPIIPIYLNFKQKAKAVSTYGRVWFDYAREDGRIHTKFKPIVSTGRTACGDTKSGPFPNTQNITTMEGTRKCFKSRGANRLVVCDYSAQEGVIMADRSKESKLLEFYKSGGGDIHSYIAKLIYHKTLSELTLEDVKELHPDLRIKSKKATFAIQFGGNGYTIANNLNIPQEQGDEIYDAYFEAFPDLKKYFDKVHREALTHGYILVNSFTGRKRFLDNFKYYAAQKSNPKTADSKGVENFERAVRNLALNTPIQGTAADISKVAGCLFFEWVVESGLFGKVKIVNFVHDEYVIECPTSKAEAVGKKLQELMEKAGTYFLTELELKAVPHTGVYWEH